MVAYASGSALAVAARQAPANALHLSHIDTKRCAMATLKHSPGNHQVVDASTPDKSIVKDTIEARRARRMAALRKVAGIWSDRTDIPADGLDYQQALRSEWQA